MDAWEKAAKNEPSGALAIDIDDHSQRLTLDIVTSLAFNKDFKQVEGIDAQLNGGPARTTPSSPASSTRTITPARSWANCSSPRCRS